MITKETYTLEYVNSLREKYKKDPSLLEGVLFAFGLLEAITRVGMPFIFKGGTSLMLILDHPLRLSTDIDILVKPGTDVDHYINEATKLFPFKTFDEDRRVGKNNIEKRHFKFIYDSPLRNDFAVCKNHLHDVIIPYVLCLGTNSILRAIPIPSANRFNRFTEGFLVPFSSLLISA